MAAALAFSAFGGAVVEGATPAALEPGAGLAISVADGAAVLAFWAFDRVVRGAGGRPAVFEPEAFPPLRERVSGLGPTAAASTRTVALRGAAFGEAPS